MFRQVFATMPPSPILTLPSQQAASGVYPVTSFPWPKRPLSRDTFSRFPSGPQSACRVWGVNTLFTVSHPCRVTSMMLRCTSRGFHLAKSALPNVLSSMLNQLLHYILHRKRSPRSSAAPFCSLLLGCIPSRCSQLHPLYCLLHSPDNPSTLDPI